MRQSQAADPYFFHPSFLPSSTGPAVYKKDRWHVVWVAGTRLEERDRVRLVLAEMDPSNSSTIPLSTPPIFDALLPGSSQIFPLLSHYFKIDVSFILSLLLMVTGVAAALKYCGTIAWYFITDHLVSRVEIRQDDEIYNYVMAWVSKQPFSRKTPLFVAGVKTDSNFIWTSDPEADEEANDNDSGLDLTGDFDDYWTVIANRDKFKPLRYTPADGTHLFRYKNRFLAFNRSKEDKGAIFFGTQSERIHISCLGRNGTILKELVEEAQIAYLEQDGDRTVIYRASQKGQGGEPDWQRCMSRPPRPLSTVVLDDVQKQAVIKDVKEYLNPLTRRWYSNRGIPYRRGYLLHGPPGTGKTSLCFAMAGLLHLKIYVVSLNSRSLTEDGLAALFQSLPLRCIVLMEDIDAAGLTSNRTEGGDASSEESSAKLDVETGKKDESKPRGISLAALLNIIDGVASSEGRILVMTTNHIEKLDKALLRPGRVDMTIGVGFASLSAIRGLFAAIYTPLKGDLPPGFVGSTKPKSSGAQMNGVPWEKGTLATSEKGPVHSTASPSTKPRAVHNSAFSHQYTTEEVRVFADRFAEAIPADEFTPAEIQGYLLKHKYDPKVAVENASSWVHTVQEERRKSEEQARLDEATRARGQEAAGGKKSEEQTDEKETITSGAEEDVKGEKLDEQTDKKETITPEAEEDVKGETLDEQTNKDETTTSGVNQDVKKEDSEVHAHSNGVAEPGEQMNGTPKGPLNIPTT